MVKMKEEEKSAGIDIDEESICRRVLGPEKYGYTPGLGPTPRKNQIDEVSNEPQLEDFKQLYENLSTNFDEFRKDTTEKYDALMKMNDALMKMMQSVTNQSPNPAPLNINIIESPPSTPLSAHSVSDPNIYALIFYLYIFL